MVINIPEARENESPRCGAKTRDGTPCMAPVVPGKTRCRIHGGAPGSGAPIGNTNAVTHGKYRKEQRGLEFSLARAWRDIVRYLGNNPSEQDWFFRAWARKNKRRAKQPAKHGL